MKLALAEKENLIRLAQREAERALAQGNPPFGALLVDERGEVIATAYNTQRSLRDPTGHAEINLLRKAADILGSIHFHGFALVTNAEPCPMCMSAAIRAKIQYFYFGAPQEATVDPQISANELAGRAQGSIHIEGGILGEATRKQILRGRERLLRIDSAEPVKSGATSRSLGS